MKPTKLRFAICGAGSVGPELAPYITEVAQVTAVCDPDAQKRARFRERSPDPAYAMRCVVGHAQYRLPTRSPHQDPRND